MDAATKDITVEDKSILTDSQVKLKLEPFKEIYTSVFGEVESF